MSRENVELVQGLIDAHDGGDFTQVFALYHPEIEWHVMPTAGSDFERVYHGHDGVRSFWRQWFAAWETVSFDYEEFIDAGDNVVSVLTQRMRGRTSGIELEWNSYAQVWTVKDGKVVRVEFFMTRDEAVEAVGLRE